MIHNWVEEVNDVYQIAGFLVFVNFIKTKPYFKLKKNILILRFLRF